MSTAAPRVSLLIPCYNAAEYLPAMAASIRALTVPFAEILCYDDGSSDDTLATARRLGLVTIAGGINRGAAHARNQLAHRSTCEWLHFHDADDPLQCDFLAQMRPLLRPEVDVAVCDADWVDADSHGLILAWRYAPELLRTDPLRTNLRNGVSCNAMIARRAPLMALNGFDETLRMWEDADLHIRLAHAGARYVALGSVASVSFRHRASLSHDYRTSWGCRLSALERYATTLPARVRPDLAAQAEIAARELLRHRDFPSARRALFLNHDLGGSAPSSHHGLIRALRLLFGPWLALRLQEYFRTKSSIARATGNFSLHSAATPPAPPDPDSSFSEAHPARLQESNGHASVSFDPALGKHSRQVTLGIGGILGHDANAALLVDGQLIGSSQEERHTRVKHDGSFPRRAALDCLRASNLAAADVTDIVFAEKALQARFFELTSRPGNAFTRTLSRFLPESSGSLYAQQARALFPAARFHHAWHHLSHVAGAFHSSSFDRAAFLCVDGKGEDYSASAGVIDHDEIRLLWEQPYAHGLGMFYTLLTYHLGFLSFGSEYKVMGLAPYGTPRYTGELARLFTTDDRGGFRLRREIAFAWQPLLDALPWVAETTGIPARANSDPLLSVHLDLAASLQKIFEHEVLKMARFLRAATGEPRLLFCGGCAQNCVAAGQLRRAGIFGEIFNSPVGGDMGSGLGAALLHERTRTKSPLRIATRGFYLGSDPGPAPPAAQPYRVDFGADLHAFVAARLAEGQIVAVVRGGMELGARALGARSILADPRAPGMQSRLNLAVKFRESFRPFAPAILAEHVGEWFDSAAESDYMNYTAYLRPELRVPVPAELTGLRAKLDFPRCSIPSVIHVDFSARLQTIRASVHPDFHRFISAFHALTGVPILINTSFNVAGQPIVRTAAEGWDCFVNTDIDLLVLNDEVFRHPRDKTREQKLAWLANFSAHA